MLRERVRLPVGERSQLRAVLTRVVRFYDAAGKPEAAEKYRQELTKLNP